MAKETPQNALFLTTKALSAVQAEVLTADTLKKLVNTLLGKTLPVSAEEISIIYQDYSAAEPHFLTDEPELPFAKDHPAITAVISKDKSKCDKNGRLYFASPEACNKENFPGYASVLILPMRLTDEKNAGVMIIHSTDRAQAYGAPDDVDEGSLIDTLDNLSDRFGYFLRHNIRKQRNPILWQTMNQALQRSYDTETQVIEDILESLKRWYQDCDFYVLVRNSLNIDTFFMAYNKDQAISDFRKYDALTEMQLEQYLGPNPSKCLEIVDIEGVHQLDFAIGSESSNSAGSALVARMFLPTPGINIGYLVVSSPGTTLSFEPGDEQFLDEVTNFMALLLGNVRKDYNKNWISKIYDFSIDKNPEQLFEETAESLEKVFGIQSLLIAVLSNDLKNIEVKHQTKRLASTPELEKLLFDYILTKNIKPISEQGEGFNRKDFFFSYQDEKLFAVPMRVEHRNIGCFLIRAPKIGKLAAMTLDAISDALARKYQEHTRQQRSQSLAELATKTSQQTSSGMTQEKVIELAYEYVKQAMYSDNFYIALYDQNKNEISFPKALLDGKSWEGIHGTTRPLDESKKGKTEWIILNKKSIAHLTKEQAIDWYKEPGNNEYAGNYLASWIGVPIFSGDSVIGVIAVFHEKLNYIYSEHHVDFLKQVAGLISSLFRILQLEEANKQLEEAIRNNSELKKANKQLEEAIRNNTELRKANKQLEESKVKIADQQHMLSTSLLAQDLTHRLNNSVASISINIDQAYKDIELARNTGNMTQFEFTLEGLEDANIEINNLLKETSQITDDSKKPINIEFLIRKIAKQIKIEKKIPNEKIILDIPKDFPDIYAHERTLFNSFYAIIDNAAYSLSQSSIPEIDKKIIIKAENLTEKIKITFYDNGEEIEKSIKDDIFKYGVSTKNSTGFGLWRARAVSKSLGGDLELSDSETETGKSFIMTIPKEEPIINQKSIFILDDERSWRNIINRWLSSEGYDVYAASDKESMLELLEESEVNPKYIFLDVALNKIDGANRDGLTLIEIARSKKTQSKIIILTGYPESTIAYQNDYDLLIEKVNSDGNIALSKEKLLSQLESLKQ